MKFENVLLGLLALKPLHGYELMKWLDTEGQFLRSNTHHSQIYRELGRMVTNGLVEFHVDPREGRPDAKVYRITEVGREALVEWVHSPYKPTSRFQDADFNARFVFTAQLDPAAAVVVIDTELEYRRAQVLRSRTRSLTMADPDPIPEIDLDRVERIGIAMHEFGKESVDRWIEWLEEMRASLVAEIASTAEPEASVTATIAEEARS
ncbi:PadR family transcriptional regulator [Agromyces sp. GXQ0307]|uniref:PadR family transcriptional regulator n=1 Tax=Agromyces sp. GXQ0307 TaxID=3377835 RepID=UPI00383BF5BC